MRFLFSLLAVFSTLVFSDQPTSAKQDKPCMKLGVLPLGHGLDRVKLAGERLFASVGHCVTFVIAPVRRAEALTLNGSLDGQLLRTKVWAQSFGDQVVVVPTPLFTDDILAVSLAHKNISVQSLDDLVGWRVLITGGHRWAEAQLAERGITPVTASTATRYLELLELDRVDVGLTERVGIEPLQGKPQFAVQPIAKIDYHIVLRSAHMSLIADLDAAVAALRAQRKN